MDTAEIHHRVADFLKRHPPFNVVEEADLLALAATGRVRFHEPNEYILWQGEPHRHQVFVIQQGTVSLWDETGGRSALRDVRGAGDMLGLERYNGARQCPHSARSESDVVIYAFPADDFAQFVLKDPRAAQFVEADARVTPDYQDSPMGREPHQTLLRSIVPRGVVPVCRTTDTVAAAASRMLTDGPEAIAVLNSDDRIAAVLTAESILGWVAAGHGDPREQLIGTLRHEAPAVLGFDASVADGILAMGAAGAVAVAITADGTATGAVDALITRSDFARFFGEQPADLLREIRQSRTCGELSKLNQRVRAATLEHLTGTTSVEWLAKLTSQADATIASQLLALDEAPPVGCWCFCGSSGRGESLTRVSPALAVIVGDTEDVEAAREQHRRVVLRLSECGYLPRRRAFETAFYVARADEWIQRYRGWVSDPVIQQLYRARTLFDLRPIHGQRGPWNEVSAAVAGMIDRDFLHVLANDVLANVPPLTFYQDAVVDDVGERFAMFELAERALRPLVDVARVFGMAGGAVLGRSTLERFAVAGTLLPDHDQIFSEAIDTFRVVLWQQARIGISQGTSGAELSPALLSRNDRHVLKSGFRSILRLLQFTANLDWLTRL